MDLHNLLLFAGAILVLFFTPGPGIAAMIARTLQSGPRQGALYGLGIVSGDMIWLTLAVLGLSSLSDVLGPYAILIKIIGGAFLVWMAYGAFRSAMRPQAEVKPPLIKGRLGLLATYLTGIAMPLSNPKAIVFYLSFLPAFFDLSQVRLIDYLSMIIIMFLLFILWVIVYVGLAHKARDFLLKPKVKRYADFATGFVMLGVAGLLLIK